MIDEPGAFASREWLRKLVAGKAVQFETKRQGGASDRVYGWLYVVPDETNSASGSPIHIALESVRNGHATPKDNMKRAATNGDSQQTATSDNKDEAANDDENPFAAAYLEAQNSKVGIHGALPVVRTLKAAGDGFDMTTLVQYAQKLGVQGRVACVLEHVFDGSRFRCQVVDTNLGPDWVNASFTLLLAGITCPRIGKDATTPSEEFAEEAKAFSELRLLQRELPITLHGTDKSGVCGVGTIHHPKGNIAVELLKNGLAKMTDWSVRLMNPLDVPALRIAEHTAKVSVKKEILLHEFFHDLILAHSTFCLLTAHQLGCLARLRTTCSIGCFRSYWNCVRSINGRYAGNLTKRRAV
jgi:staphylococcal nuclease domain-containing protein 1